MSISQFAAQVAAAEQVLAEAERHHNETKAEAERRQTRLADLKAELHSIAERRREGDREDADAGRVVLLRLDIDGIEPLARIAQAEAQTTLQAVLDARDRLAKSNQELGTAWAQEQAEALEARLRQIEETFARGIAELAKLKKRANPMFVAAPAHVFPLCPALRGYQQGVIPQ